MRDIDLSGWTPKELRELADKIYANLGLSSDIDLEAEMLNHYRRCNSAADLALTSLEEGATSAGAAAVLTAATGSLRELAKLQTDLYNAGRVKIFEKALQETLRRVDDSGAVLDIFEAELARLEGAEG